MSAMSRNKMAATATLRSIHGSDNMKKIENEAPIRLTHKGIHGETEAEAKGRAALQPGMNALMVIDTFKRHVMGNDVDMGAMLEALQNSMRQVKEGDLSGMEAMLVGQATALQTMFAGLALRASGQQHLPKYQAFMGLALKAQAQSRATIQALVDLKYPRQATFVRQANIAHGPQQVNNGPAPTGALSHGKNPATMQNKLLEQDHEQTHRLDTGAAGAPGRADPAMATVGQVYRPPSAAGKAAVSRNAFKGGHWRELRDLIVRTNGVLREQKRLLENISPDDAGGGGGSFNTRG
ncbi:MAG: hypothetical protein P4L96_21820 [Rhodoferax sp.]|nr:hypothetical protein [Rhodoferax sp.]